MIKQPNFNFAEGLRQRKMLLCLILQKTFEDKSILLKLRVKKNYNL